jgi:hypothetical protein
MTNPTSNFGWQMPTSTDLVTDLPADFEVFGQAVDTSLADLQGGTTGQVLAKASNTNMDFSWVAIDPLVILDAKGDLITATAADTPARLAVGANDTVLMADSTTSTGLKWATPAAGGMTLISETTASALSSLSLSSIPGTYKQLLLIWSGINHSATGSIFNIRLNNNSGSIYCINEITFNGGISQDAIAYSSITGGFGGPFGNGVTATTLENAVQGSLLIDNYSSSTKLKAFSCEWAYKPVSTLNYVLERGVFNSTTAITSIDIVRSSGSATFSNITNTSIRLYGIS